MYVEWGDFLDSKLAHMVALAREVDLAPGPGGSRITPLTGVLLERALAILVGVWPGNPRERVQLVSLEPSAQIVAHCDPPIVGTRAHVPLIVNEHCWSYSGGVWMQLALGKTYQMDPTVVHGAVNWGLTRRVHLMVDLAPWER